MRFVMLYHSIVSDWNNGNAHFLRGVVRELHARGHDVAVWEPADGWSRRNLIADHGQAALDRFAQVLPIVRPRCYPDDADSVAQIIDGADVVIVHEWNDPELVAEVGRLRGESDFIALFHDTHHRALSAPQALEKMGLENYDGILAFGRHIAETYVERGWNRNVFVWHEAADVQLFRPQEEQAQGDVVWVGNWGDGERTEELETFLLDPVAKVGASGTVHGVRYPTTAINRIREAGMEYAGYLPNDQVPRVFAAHSCTIHVPRRWYSESLPGIPTIRVFEALACGIPLISAPWEDTESLFRAGHDFLMVENGKQMSEALDAVLHQPALAGRLASRGLETILAGHTCAHRVDELFETLAVCRSRQPREELRRVV